MKKTAFLLALLALILCGCGQTRLYNKVNYKGQRARFMDNFTGGDPVSVQYKRNREYYRSENWFDDEKSRFKDNFWNSYNEDYLSNNPYDYARFGDMGKYDDEYDILKPHLFKDLPY